MTVAPTGPEYVPANSDFEPIVSPPSDLEFAEPSEQQHVEEHSQPSQSPPVAPGMESEQLPSAPTPSESDDTPVSDIPATILTDDTPNTVFSVLSDTQMTALIPTQIVCYPVKNGNVLQLMNTEM